MKKIIEKIKELEKEGKVIPATNDVVFKNLFQDEKTKGSLAHIISEITGLDKEEIINNMVFKNTELMKNKISEKGKITDLLVEVNKNYIILEMNEIYNKSKRLKNDSYHRKVASEAYLVGKELEEKKMLMINFNKKQKYDDRKIIKCLMMDEERNQVYDENFVNYQVNLDKFMQMYYNKEKLNKFEKMMVMLMLEDKEELRALAQGDKELEAMAKKIEEMSKDTFVIGQYDKESVDAWTKEIDLREAHKEGEAKGEVKGKNEKSLEIAKSMLKDKMDVKLISKHTGLSKEEIESLK